MKVKRQVPFHPPFESGQVWQMDGVTCHIGQVGKTLVHYKLLNGDVVRGSNSLSNKEVLVKHLTAKQAVLVRDDRATNQLYQPRSTAMEDGQGSPNRTLSTHSQLRINMSPVRPSVRSISQWRSKNAAGICRGMTRKGAFR